MLRFSKGQVYVHPSLDARENIPGFLSIIQQVRGAHAAARRVDREPEHGHGTEGVAGVCGLEQVDGSILLAWTPDCLVEEPYVALQRTNAPGAAPGHAVPVDLSLSDMANGTHGDAVGGHGAAAAAHG